MERLGGNRVAFRKQELENKPIWMKRLEQLLEYLIGCEETQKQQVEGLRALLQAQEGNESIWEEVYGRRNSRSGSDNTSCI